VTSFFGIKVCVIFENDKTNLRQIFSGFFYRKHLFITTCIEKHCTRLLNDHVSGGIWTLARKLTSIVFQKKLLCCVLSALGLGLWLELGLELDFGLGLRLGLELLEIFKYVFGQTSIRASALDPFPVDLK